MILLVGLVIGVGAMGAVIALAVMLSQRGSGAREGSPLIPATPATQASAAPGAIPAAWGWARLNQQGRKSVGYYYRDRTAGPSFHILFDEDAEPPTPEQLREMRYRGSVTTRLGAHESMQIPEGVPNLVAMMQRTFDSGGTSGTVVLKLMKSERDGLGLPDAPEWISAYLR